MLGVVAGSGMELEGLFDSVEARIPFRDMPGLANTKLFGHNRCFIRGRCGHETVVLQCGRFHFYEGLSLEQVTAPVEAMARLGVDQMIFTNAVGALDDAIRPGQLVNITECALWPCRLWPDHPDRAEPDMHVPGCDVAGRYLWVHGPCYETPAEVRAMRALAEVVGMSAAPEVVRCRELGLAAAVISSVTNACGGHEKLTHEHVVATAARNSNRLVRIIRAYIGNPRDKETE